MTFGRRHIIDEVLPVYNVKVRINVPEEVKVVRVEPSGERLDFVQKDGAIELVVPRIDLHSIIVVGTA